MAKVEKKKERIICFVIYKSEGKLVTETSKDMPDYELYGFLDCYMRHLKYDLTDSLEPRDKSEGDLLGD